MNILEEDLLTHLNTMRDLYRSKPRNNKEAIMLVDYEYSGDERVLDDNSALISGRVIA